MKNYRLGLYMGSGYLSWCTIGLNKNNEPIEITDSGVRIYSDGREPKTNESKAVKRRLARSMRRLSARYRGRTKKLKKTLIKLNLWSSNEEEIKNVLNNDPFRLRYEALNRELTAYQLGRVILALNSRRGFKSNRLDPIEAESLETPTENLSELVKRSGCRTLGEYFWTKHPFFENKKTGHVEWLVSPLSKLEGEPRKTRDLYESEFDIIVKNQKKYHSISEENWQKIKNIIFFQFPLRPVEKGFCQLYFKDKLPRANAAIPSAQMFLALEQINKLKIIGSERKITSEERDKIFNTLCQQKTLTFKKIRKILGLEDDEDLRLGDSDSDRLTGVVSSFLMRNKKYFGDKWDELSLQTQDEIIDIIVESDSADNIKEKIQGYDLTQEQITNISEIQRSELPYGQSRFSQKALIQIVSLMERGITYSEAIIELGLSKSEGPGKLLKSLPYYGFVMPEVIANSGTKRGDPEEKQSGIIANPSHHIGFNQLRKVVNALIAEYGHPYEISLELARELKMSAKNKKKFNKDKKDREKKNKEVFSKLKDLAAEGHDIDYFRDREKYELWDELGDIKQCPLTGKTIGITSLFSDNFVVEHILPLDLTLDDTMANKMLCDRQAAIYKGERSPYDAFGASNDNYNYREILRRSSKLPKNKSWRFEHDAMELFNDKEKFVENQLNDKKYLSQITARYLRFICTNVRVSPGRLTSKLRKEWGLNGVFNEIINDCNPKKEVILKNVEDHRRHAIDAIVVGMFDKTVIEKALMALRSKKITKLHFDCPMNVDNLHKQIKNIITRIIVSHRVDHNKNGQLCDETYYGYCDKKDKKRGYTLVTRKKITDLSSLNEIYSIRGRRLRKKIYDIIKPIIPDSIDDDSDNLFKENLFSVLSDFSEKSGIKRVRLLKKMGNESYEIRHGDSNQHYKVVVPKDIHHVGFWKMPDDSIEGKGVSRFLVNIPNKKIDKRPHPAAKLLMKMHKGDMIELDYTDRDTNDNGEVIKTVRRVIGIVLSLRPSNKVITWTHHFADLKNQKHESFVFNKLININVKKINVNVIGKYKCLAE